MLHEALVVCGGGGGGHEGLVGGGFRPRPSRRRWVQCGRSERGGGGTIYRGHTLSFTTSHADAASSDCRLSFC